LRHAQMDYSDVIDIKDGRHPVVEEHLSNTFFVPNDTYLDCNDNRTAVITGPNMAGKSTYMRQVAVIVLMAQAGCFVPAKSAHLGVVDSIFTRVGASDDLASGQSTFMVEMSEVAEMVTAASKKSLLIFDEIGRGTSTFDGMSIARAVVEYVTNKNKLGAKTLFATHYHELTELEDVMDGVKNYNIAVKKRGDDITFLRKIVRGGTDDSYGIEVAKLAGVPKEITDRAKAILKILEQQKISGIEVKKSLQKTVEDDTDQISLGDMREQQVADKLRKLDLNTITPIEAMSVIYELQKLLAD
ncbi:MAG: DNA mismatch repair protein MutS, partial [Ruminococcaceae bacterium]|nr:DNA mismatch repair protein MutS [Oscillospiraceae bacterium]